jgi:hypothetical protein
MIRGQTIYDWAMGCEGHDIVEQSAPSRMNEKMLLAALEPEVREHQLLLEVLPLTDHVQGKN